MTTQPELPESAPLPALAPVMRLVPPPDAAPDVDFDSFVRRYEARLRRLVLRRLGDMSDSEEITQETLLRAYQHRESFASEDELMAWSTVVAQRLVIDRVRVRGRSVAVAEVPETARLGRDTADIVVARHEARAALEALEAIPTRQAAILWAREVEGLHYEDIAERFSITEPAVRSLLHRGRKALRKEFKDRTGSLPLNGLVPFAPWLLALRAASKVRKAAKATATNPSSTVAAIAFLGVTALTFAPWSGRHESISPQVTRMPAATVASGVTAHAVPVTDGYDLLRDSARARTAHVGGGDTDGGRENVVGACSVRACVTISKEKLPDGVSIWVGPTLPENPTGVRRVGVTVKGFVRDCEEVPDAPMTSCTSYHQGEEESEPPPQPLPIGAGTPLSGGTR